MTWIRLSGCRKQYRSINRKETVKHNRKTGGRNPAGIFLFFIAHGFQKEKVSKAGGHPGREKFPYAIYGDEVKIMGK